MPRGVRLFKRKRGGIEPENVSKEHGIPIETVMASFGLASAKGGATDAKKEGTKDNVPPSNDEQRSGDAGGVGADD